jgi:hypothetical protein
MKKLKLRLDNLEVSSFQADAPGSVHGMDVVMTPGCLLSGDWTCACTAEAGCYASKWCTGEGCVVTGGCETGNGTVC